LIKSKELISNGVVAVTDKMLINATVIFSLIDNVDNVIFAFDDGRGVYSFPFNRDLLNDLFDKDLREYSSSIKVFKEEFIPMLERKDWSSLRIPTDSNESTVSINPEIGNKVEEKLEIIMSSPRDSSSPAAYIKAHQDEYEDIIKMGDDALEYMLSLFESGEEKGLKAHIMMELCIEILEDRNNVEEGSYNSPEEWYAKLSPYTATKLPPFSFTSQDKIEQMVYPALIEEYSNNKKINKSNENNKDDVVNIVAPHIFGTYELEKENELKIFATVYDSEFKLYEKKLIQEGAGVIPVAIVYTKNDDGTYKFKKIIRAMDGSYFQKSIEKFCEPRDDIARAMMKHYGDYGDIIELMKKNTINYLKMNGFDGVSLKRYNGELIPLT
ncbi:MAG: hypothetical protein PHD60_05295, partial [Clostridia bacterium]|nr:hypothetical protein [Clostridia bacterium]